MEMSTPMKAVRAAKALAKSVRASNRKPDAAKATDSSVPLVARSSSNRAKGAGEQCLSMADHQAGQGVSSRMGGRLKAITEAVRNNSKSPSASPRARPHLSRGASAQVESSGQATGPPPKAGQRQIGNRLMQAAKIMQAKTSEGECAAANVEPIEGSVEQKETKERSMARIRAVYKEVRDRLREDPSALERQKKSRAPSLQKVFRLFHRGVKRVILKQRMVTVFLEVQEEARLRKRLAWELDVLIQAKTSNHRPDEVNDFDDLQDKVEDIRSSEEVASCVYIMRKIERVHDAFFNMKDIKTEAFIRMGEIREMIENNRIALENKQPPMNKKVFDRAMKELQEFAESFADALEDLRDELLRFGVRDETLSAWKPLLGLTSETVWFHALVYRQMRVGVDDRRKACMVRRSTVVKTDVPEAEAKIREYLANPGMFANKQQIQQLAQLGLERKRAARRRGSARGSVDNPRFHQGRRGGRLSQVVIGNALPQNQQPDASTSDSHAKGRRGVIVRFEDTPLGVAASVGATLPPPPMNAGRKRSVILSAGMGGQAARSPNGAPGSRRTSLFQHGLDFSSALAVQGFSDLDTSGPSRITMVSRKSFAGAATPSEHLWAALKPKRFSVDHRQSGAAAFRTSDAVLGRKFVRKNQGDTDSDDYESTSSSESSSASEEGPVARTSMKLRQSGRQSTGPLPAGRTSRKSERLSLHHRQSAAGRGSQEARLSTRESRRSRSSRRSTNRASERLSRKSAGGIIVVQPDAGDNVGRTSVSSSRSSSSNSSESGCSSRLGVGSDDELDGCPPGWSQVVPSPPERRIVGSDAHQPVAAKTEGSAKTVSSVLMAMLKRGLKQPKAMADMRLFQTGGSKPRQGAVKGAVKRAHHYNATTVDLVVTNRHELQEDYGPTVTALGGKEERTQLPPNSFDDFFQFPWEVKATGDHLTEPELPASSEVPAVESTAIVKADWFAARGTRHADTPHPDWAALDAEVTAGLGGSFKKRDSKGRSVHYASCSSPEQEYHSALLEGPMSPLPLSGAGDGQLSPDVARELCDTPLKTFQMMHVVCTPDDDFARQLQRTPTSKAVEFWGKEELGCFARQKKKALEASKDVGAHDAVGEDGEAPVFQSRLKGLSVVAEVA